MTDLRETVERTIADAQLHPFIGPSERRIADALLPVISAHEAEVVGRILDRIDALHGEHRDTHPDLAAQINRPWFCCVRVQLGGIAETDCNACGEPHPCPTRRLTAEIRGEMSHG